MQPSSLSTIAQVLCNLALPMNFAALVGSLGRQLDAQNSHPFKARWDDETVVIFDQPGTRVVLGWAASPTPFIAGVLTLSVGPSDMLGKPVMRPDAAALCQSLVAEILARVEAAEVLWHQIACLMTADWVELLLETLSPSGAKASSSALLPDAPARAHTAVPFTFAPA